MPPVATLCNKPNRTIANAKAFGQVFRLDTLGQLATDLTDHSLGQLRAPIPDTDGLSPFSIPISQIGEVVTKPQMGRIHAQRVIARRAVVADIQSLRDCSMSKLPRNNVRPARRPIAMPELSVVVASSASCPQPASIRPTAAIHFCPKSLGVVRGILRVHDEPPTRCAMPPAVRAARGLQCANYSIGMG